MHDMLLAFIIGSSWISSISFFIGFHGIQSQVNKNNCAEKIFGINTYYTYTVLAPLYIGLMSAFAIWFSKKYEISTRKCFLIIGIISAIIVSIIITICNIYNWSTQRYMLQYAKLQIYHFIIYSVVIATLYLYLNKFDNAVVSSR